MGSETLQRSVSNLVASSRVSLALLTLVTNLLRGAGCRPCVGMRRLLHVVTKKMMDKSALMAGINLRATGLTFHMLSKSLVPDDTNLLFFKTAEL